MEGRAIARPNCGPPDVNTPDVVASMEGRAIARPNAAMTLLEHGSRGLQWRAEQLPGQTRIFATESPSTPMPLQWRAEQLPGQTIGDPPQRRYDLAASMEGRAIARPNRRRAAQEEAEIEASMEDRAIARPNPVLRHRRRLRQRASMEGRAIARPNPASDMGWVRASLLQWRAEQLPGQTGVSTAPRATGSTLQWRAEQLPGQTAATGFPQRRRWCFNGGPSNCPAKPARPDHAGGPELLASMEGRAIARPNWATWREQPCQRPLQWRAEQLPGQTRTR